VAVNVDINGLANAEELIPAIRIAVINNEILNCKIEMDDKGVALYSKISKPVYKIKMTTDKWTDIVLQQEKLRFEIEKGELIRFFIRYREDAAQLLILAHHLAGDGISMCYLVQDILCALSGKELNYKPIKLLVLDELPENSRLSIPMSLMLRVMNSKWRKSGKAFGFNDFDRVFNTYWNNRETIIDNYTITGDEYQSLVIESKKHNVTINSVITTALLRADAQRADVGLAVNIREHDYTGMGNYATGISLNYAYDENKDFWINAEAVHKLIYAKLMNNRKKYFLMQFMGGIEPTLIDAVYFSAYDNYENKTAKTFQKMFGYDGNPKGISLTNLTRLPIPHIYGNYSINDITFVPPLVLNAKRILGISTLNNKMNISLHIEKNSDAAKNMEFFRQAMEYLKFGSRKA
jgi:Uncharacterized protein containing a NRPS condensation (elongation) domain